MSTCGHYINPDLSIISNEFQVNILARLNIYSHEQREN